MSVDEVRAALQKEAAILLIHPSAMVPSTRATAQRFVLVVEVPR